LSVRKKQEETLLHREIVVRDDDDDDVSEMGSVDKDYHGGAIDADEDQAGLGAEGTDDGRGAKRFVGDDRYMGDVVASYLRQKEEERYEEEHCDEDEHDVGEHDDRHDEEGSASDTGSSISSKSIKGKEAGREDILGMGGAIDDEEEEDTGRGAERVIDSAAKNRGRGKDGGSDGIVMTRIGEGVGRSQPSPSRSKSPISPSKATGATPKERLQRRIEKVVAKQKQQQEQQKFHQLAMAEMLEERFDSNAFRGGAVAEEDVPPNPFWDTNDTMEQRQRDAPRKKIAPLNPPPRQSSKASTRRARLSRGRSTGSSIEGVVSKGVRLNRQNSFGSMGSAFSSFSPVKPSTSPLDSPSNVSPATPKTAPLDSSAESMSPEQFQKWHQSGGHGKTNKQYGRSKSDPGGAKRKGDELSFSPIVHHPNTVSAEATTLPDPVSPRARRGSAPTRSRSVEVQQRGRSAGRIGGGGVVGGDPRDAEASPRIRALSAAARRRVRDEERRHGGPLLSIGDRAERGSGELASGDDSPIVVLSMTTSAEDDFAADRRRLSDLMDESTAALLDDPGSYSSGHATRWFSESIFVAAAAGSDGRGSRDGTAAPGDGADADDGGDDDDDDSFYQRIRGGGAASRRPAAARAGAPRTFADDGEFAGGRGSLSSSVLKKNKPQHTRHSYGGLETCAR
jgi:hypothetical protein